MAGNSVLSKLRGEGVVRAIRSVRRLVRHGPDRVLHHLRRPLAVARLRRRRMPESVLFVCHGNICRSPYAAAVLKRELAARSVLTVRVDSAGFLGSGRPSPPAAVEAASRRGIDLSDHRSISLLPQLVGRAELVVVMDARQRRAIHVRFGRRSGDLVMLGDVDPKPIATRAIRDPVNGTVEVFDTCYARIDRALQVLATALAGRRAGTPAPAEIARNGRGGGPHPGEFRSAKSSARVGAPVQGRVRR